MMGSAKRRISASKSWDFRDVISVVRLVGVLWRGSAALDGARRPKRMGKAVI